MDEKRPPGEPKTQEKSVTCLQCNLRGGEEKQEV